MKLLSLFSIAPLFFLVAGCDEDGDDTAPAATETVTEIIKETTEECDERRVSVVLDTGSDTLLKDITKTVSSFSVFETGMLEAIIVHSGMDNIDASLIHVSGASEDVTDAPSPVNLLMQVTQALLDNGNDWILEVTNLDYNSGMSLEFIVRFSPD
jgi:hypothetical protein